MATVSVRGTGTAAAQPDDVTVGLGVEALRTSASEAFAEATRLAADVVLLCEELGVPAGSRTKGSGWKPGTCASHGSLPEYDVSM